MRVLLVEDEIATRKGLIKYVNWSKLQVDEVREASNGQKALELLTSYQFDILITDIRMPVMNGIELATRVKELYPHRKVIFLSGFSDKEYLKAAINLGVIHYVEKPIDVVEVENAIVKAVKLYNEDMKKVLGFEMTYSAKQELIKKLIRKGNGLAQVPALLKHMQIAFDEKTILGVLLIKVSKSFHDYDIQQIYLETEKIVLSEINEENALGSAIDMRQIVWILSNGDREFKKTIQNIFEKLEKENIELAKHLFFSVGTSITGLDNIHVSYMNASANLQNLFFTGYGQVSYYKNLAVCLNTSPDVMLAEFKTILKEADIVRIKELCSQIFSKIYRFENMSSNDVKNFFFQLCIELYKDAEKRISFQRLKGKNEREPFLWERIFEIETLKELIEFSEEEINAVLSVVNEAGIYSKSIMLVKRLIERQYMDPESSTNYLATKVYLTNTYLSSLFKKEVGITISRYITQVRIEASKDFLKDHKLKMWEIAKNVGYMDPNYYAKAFKSIVGITPSEFREKQWA